MKQLKTVASDYAIAGMLMYLRNSSPESTIHSYTIETLADQLQSYVDSGFTTERTSKFVEGIERMGVGTFYDDPYADSIFQISDAAIPGFFTSRANAADIYARAWNLDLAWLKTAYSKPEFWQQVDLEPREMLLLAPSEIGQLDLQSNSEAFKRASELVDELLVGLSESNDVGMLTSEEVQQARIEVEAIKEQLQTAKVESPTFYKVTRASLTWLAKQAAGAVVGTLALAALAAIFNIPFVSF